MVILDTNVVSELMMSSPNPGVLEWLETRQPAELFISAISEAELRFGAEVLPSGRRRESLLADIDRMLTTNFPGRVLPFDQDAARAYASIAAARRRIGQPIGHADCQIAAIARSVGTAVATRDAGGFRDCGIEVIDPWFA